MPHVVVLGCGFAGLWAAQGLKRAAADVTVINRVVVMVDWASSYWTYNRYARIFTRL